MVYVDSVVRSRQIIAAEGFYPVASAPVGNIHWAGSETAHEHAGYIEGAIASGERAAREISASLEN